MRIFLLLLLLCLTGMGSKAQVSPARKTFAVVIGISDYGTGGIPHLKYADRDAQAFAGYLKSPAGGSVPEEQIKLLVNEQASLLNIDIALRWLIKSCNAGDLAYFYFSGHGDVENSTVNPTGFLLCYNAPVNNYNISSLEVRRVNDFANTISRTTGGNIIMITDACHSGKLSGAENAGSTLVGAELAKVRNQEVRITSCSADEKSLEIDDLAGGRGLFSYYLLNGFEGAADVKADGVVTLQEIREFLNTALSRDPNLKFNNMKQSPVVEGRDDFKLAAVDSVTKAATLNQPAPVVLVSAGTDQEDLTEPLPLGNYFFEQLKKYNLDEMVRNAPAKLKTPADILHYFVSAVKKSDTAGIYAENLNRFNDVINDPDNESLTTEFANRLASVCDDRGQAVINLYLNGDESELQKRMYYNGGQSFYDVYPKMFSLARILIGKENVFMNQILEVKQYYFAGLATRLKTFTSPNTASLLKEALAWEQKALVLEKNGAFIYNEIGVIYKLQGNKLLAEKNFLQATKLLPKWGIPWLNLASVYISKNNLVNGAKAVDEAEASQPALYNLKLAKGFLMEKKNDLLQAEELYHGAISLNNRHYFPYERLGYVYLNSSRYALADSFFHEASLRKNGMKFNWVTNPADPENSWVLPPIPPHFITCPDARRDTANPYYLFYLADSAFNSLNYPWDTASNDPTYAFAETYYKKAIKLDPQNYLSFHYMSEMLVNRKKWQEAEQYLYWANQYYRERDQFIYSCDSLSEEFKVKDPGLACWVEYYKNAYPHFLRKGGYYLKLALLHKTWQHTNDAIENYRNFIDIDPASRINEYRELAQLYEHAGLYRETEAAIKESVHTGKDNPQTNAELNLDLDRFYKRMIVRFPEETEWRYKAGNFLYYLVQTDPGTFPIHGYHVDSFSHALKYQELPFDFHYNQKTQVVFQPRRRAIEHLLQVVQSRSADSNSRADIYYKTGDLYGTLYEADSATQFFAKSLLFRSDNANTRMKLAENDSSCRHLSDAMHQLDTLDMMGALNAKDQVTLASYKLYAGLPSAADTLLAKSAEAMPYPVRWIRDLQGLSASMKKNYRLAALYYMEALKLNPLDSDATYNVARSMALSGKTDQGMGMLEQAVRYGFRYYHVLQADPAWNKMKSTAAFQSLFKKYEGKIYVEPKELIPAKDVYDPDLDLRKE